MSAWYVLSALGLYQVTPGVPECWFGSSRFDDVTVHLPHGKSMHIVATGAGAGNIYVAGILLNGHTVNGYKITHRDLMAGGELRFEMTRNFTH
jgi:putative alpha-1,2-mannosidase